MRPPIQVKNKEMMKIYKCMSLKSTPNKLSEFMIVVAL